jgi:DNA helicase-2/ATP-dependent DNA helicase PcrA
MVAGAGSGKTTSLVKALSHIENQFGQALKQNGQNIACITYTEIAVSEILSDVGSNSIFHVSTIHSFLWDLIKPFQSDISFWVQQRMKEKLSELQLEKATFGSRVQQKTRERNARAIERIELQIPNIGSVKRFTYGTGSKYIEGILGHDDIIKMVPELIKAKPILCSIISQRYPFFFVDESQDTVPEVDSNSTRVGENHKARKFPVPYQSSSCHQQYTSQG